MKVKCKTRKIEYNNEKQGFGGTAPNTVESYAEGVVSEHKVQMNHVIGMDITLYTLHILIFDVISCSTAAHLAAA